LPRGDAVSRLGHDPHHRPAALPVDLALAAALHPLAERRSGTTPLPRSAAARVRETTRAREAGFAYPSRVSGSRGIQMKRRSLLQGAAAAALGAPVLGGLAQQ